MTVLYVILALLALVLIIAAFLPKTFELKAETTINASKQEVRDYVRFFDNQKNYSVRVMADPNSKLSYKGSQGEVGAMQAWDSKMKNVGAGEQEMKKMEKDTMEVEVRFERPMKAIHYATNIFEDLGNGQTKVTNIFRGTNPRPGNLISMFFLPKVEKDMQQNMDNLKAVLEKK